MPATSLAFRIILSHYLPGLFALPGLMALISLARRLQTCGWHISVLRVCQIEEVPKWVGDNSILVSFLLLTVPLILGIILDDVRHGFWPFHEDNRWEDRYVEYLSQLPEHLYRAVYDEYYYYAEFDGNSALAIGFSTPLFLLYAFTVWGFSYIFVGLGVLLALLVRLLWRSWEISLKAFFDDLETTARPHLK